MKRKLSTLLVLCLCAAAAMMFAGCGEKEEAGPYSEYNLSDYIVLPDYNSYEFNMPVPEKVTETEMEKGIEKDLAYYGIKHQTSEGVARKGDTITISYSGKLEDGTSPEGMSAEEYSLTLGDGNMIDGFEEALYGAKLGEVVTINTTFPDPYANNPDLSGKKAIFEVKILTREYVELPELTNALIQEAHEGYYQTVDEYLADVELYYEELHAKEAEQSVKDDILAKIVEETQVLKYPEDKVDERASYYIMSNMEYASNNQYDWETYLADNLQMTEDEFEAAATAYGEESVKYEMIVYAMAEKENLKITEEEYQAGMNDFLANTAKMTEEQFEANMEMTIEEYAEEYNLECELLLQEALDVLYYRVVKS